MKLYIATPINARQEPTMREKLVAAKRRVEMLKAILADCCSVQELRTDKYF